MDSRYKIETFISKYGEKEGTILFNRTEEKRKIRQRRIENGRSKPIIDPNQALKDGDAIKCEECGAIVTRLQWTHFKNICSGNVKTIEEYMVKYPDADLISPRLRKIAGVTKESMIFIHGEEEGLRLWKKYCDRQAETNTFEYKMEKYGWSLEDFEEYNKSRAATLENFIEREGEEEGLRHWNEYCDRQRYTASLEYFIERYGEDGERRFNDWRKKWMTCGNSISKIEIKVREELSNYLELDNQITLKKGKRRYIFDMGSIKNKKIIEFNGTYWHCDPRLYEPTFVGRKGIPAKEIWINDYNKNLIAMNEGYQVYVMWEMDWYKDKKNEINKLLEWWNNESNKSKKC